VSTLSQELRALGASEAIVSRCQDVERLERQHDVMRNMAATVAEFLPAAPALRAEIERLHGQVIEAMLDLAALCELGDLIDLAGVIERVAERAREEGPWH
jgi:hypothetical protein